MKYNVLKNIKRTLSMLLAVLMVGGTVLTVNAEPIAEEKADNGVIYEKMDASTVQKGEVPVAKTAGTYGYVFGGWFTADATEKTFTPCEAKPDGEAYAKFVPAYVLSVKCQNIAGTVETSTQTDMKVISCLDSTNYDSYGFEMDCVRLKDDGTVDAGESFTIADKGDLTKAYEKFIVYEDAEGTEKAGEFTPGSLFGSAAKYFTTWGVTDILAKQFDWIICVKPYWVTIDGTKVEGLTKYAHVEDGLLKTDASGNTFRYVNVPVNLRNDVPVAAGVLSVTNEGLTLLEVEGGRVFEEMAWAEKTDSVKLVGNVETISNNKQMNDIYANLRFKVASDDAYLSITNYSFKVSGEDFSDITENGYTSETYNVWDVKY